ncbi:MAG: 30S ribosomal protein S16 [Candidatus Omnitrophota bacterium]|nr:MAG: 30S ribosomal protein S16 [Candidatus Omnitrophota bacterium]
MLRIRLLKPGKSVKRRHHWKIVVIESKSARDSKFIKQLGYYDPSRELLKCDIEAYQDWVKKGAQPTSTVASLFKKYKKEVKK